MDSSPRTQISRSKRHKQLDAGREALLHAYREVRSTTEELCRPLEPEDMVVQTMPDASPTKWHLAHVTWFFETLVLRRSGESYEPFDLQLAELFNSYYMSLGQPYPRAQRGLLSRPTVAQVRAYREHVDAGVVHLLEHGSEEAVARVTPVIRVGLHHEQQHQELLLMDIKTVMAHNPLRPTYAQRSERPGRAAQPLRWVPFAGGQVEIGATESGFAYDNERPRHAVLLQPFELASRPVTSGEFLAFLEDGGYDRPEFWMADGWDCKQREGWQAPLYWERGDDGYRVMTLHGLRDVDPAEPVCHVSFFEANAYAAWAGCRLPTEFEWEHATEGCAVKGTFLESGALHPMAGESTGEELEQVFGDVWEWTGSPYAAYPGYRPYRGELGEYNGKFMVNQMVLRGGCCATPEGHMRRTYRNFYYPHQRWMFSGVRLAK